MNEVFKCRLNEQIRIYKDSPNMTVTYVDLARVIEDILELIELIDKPKVGFNNNPKEA